MLTRLRNWLRPHAGIDRPLSRDDRVEERQQSEHAWERMQERGVGDYGRVDVERDLRKPR